MMIVSVDRAESPLPKISPAIRLFATSVNGAYLSLAIFAKSAAAAADFNEFIWLNSVKKSI